MNFLNYALYGPLAAGQDLSKNPLVKNYALAGPLGAGASLGAAAAGKGIFPNVNTLLGNTLFIIIFFLLFKQWALRRV